LKVPNVKIGWTVGLLIWSCIWPACRSEGRKLELKAKVGLEYDDNVFEQIEDRVGGLAAKFYMSLSSTPFRSRKTRVSLTYRCGCKKYLGSPSHGSLSTPEPVVNYLKLALTHRLTEDVIFGIHGEVKGRALRDKGREYPLSQYGYIQKIVGLSLRTNLTTSLVTTFSCRMYSVRFDRYPESDHLSAEVLIGMKKRLYRRLWVELRALLRRSDFEMYPPTREHRRDILREAGVSLRLCGGFLISCGYSFLKNTSNTYGYGFRTHRLTLLFGKAFTKHLSFQLYSVLRFKRYIEAVQEFFPTVSLPEEMEGNVIVVRLSGDISRHLGFDVQYSLRRDETTRNVFHTKSLCSSSLRFKFL